MRIILTGGFPLRQFVGEFVLLKHMQWSGEGRGSGGRIGIQKLLYRILDIL